MIRLRALNRLNTGVRTATCPSHCTFIDQVNDFGGLHCLDNAPAGSIRRWKHSKRQVKRIFKLNPANVRNRPPTPPIPLAEPKFEPVVADIKILPNGWIPPPPSEAMEAIEKLRENLPFSVRRTVNKPNNAVGFLPVYSNTRLGGTKVTTIIKKVTGDREAFIEELKAVLKLKKKLHKTVDDMIRLRASGTVIEVDGNRTREVKSWLAGLGF